MVARSRASIRCGPSSAGISISPTGSRCFPSSEAPATGTTGSDGGAAAELRHLQALGAQFAVELVEAPGGVTGPVCTMSPLSGCGTSRSSPYRRPPRPRFRMEVHRLADEITRWAAGTPGAAASRFLFVSGGRVYRIDSDGARDHAADAGWGDGALTGLVAGRRSASRTPGWRMVAEPSCCSRSRAARARTPPARATRSTSRRPSRPTAERSRMPLGRERDGYLQRERRRIAAARNA